MLPVDIGSWHMGEAEAYSYMVKRGKLAAYLQLHEADLSNVLNLLKEDGISFLVEEFAGCDWVGVWMWHRPFVEELIKAFNEIEERLPEAARAWYLGKLFGYSDDSIEGYIAEYADFNRATNEEAV